MRRLTRAPDRPDPIGLLEEQAKSRVPELVPIRRGRMMVSPFTFYRGAALPMASDLSHTPVSGLAVQACGDAHLSNFGIFGSAERRLVFDVNDFDETTPGPWEWDVKRLATSLEVAGRGNGFSGKERREIVTAAVTRYRQAMRSFAGMANLDVWYAHADLDDLRAQFGSQLKARQRKMVDKGMAKAQTRDSMQELAKLTHLVDGRPQIISEPPLLVPVAELLPRDTDQAAFEAQVKDLLGKYRRTLETDRRFLLETFTFADLARKVVGVGSVGTRCWIVLMLGRDESDPLFLQVKEAEASVLSRFVGASKYTNMGQRVVAGQRLMQAASDIFLGWQRAEAGPGRQAARLLCPPAAGLEILHRHRGPDPARHADLRGGVRMGAGAGARLFRGPDRHRRLPRRLRRLRQGHHPVRRRVRRPERTRPPGSRRRRHLGPAHRRVRHVRSLTAGQQGQEQEAMTAEPPQSLVTEAVRSLEVRWIFPGQLEAAVAGWFGRFPARAESREDAYLLDPQFSGLSVKVRGGGALEVKAYRGSPGILEVPGRARGRLESWQKWSFPAQPAGSGDRPGWRPVHKRRRISRFALASVPVADARRGAGPGAAVRGGTHRGPHPRPGLVDPGLRGDRPGRSAPQRTRGRRRARVRPSPAWRRGTRPG